MSNIIIDYWNDRGDVANILYKSDNGVFRNRIILPEHTEAQLVNYEIEEIEEEDVRGIPEVAEQVYRKTFTINYLCDISLADAISMIKLHDKIFIRLKGENFQQVKSIDVEIDPDQAPLKTEVRITFSFEWIYKNLCGEELLKPRLYDVTAYVNDGQAEPGATGTDPVDNTSDTMTVGDAGTEYYSYLMFENVNVQNSQAISLAVIDMYAGAAETGGAIRIYGAYAATVGAPEINADVHADFFTAAYADWSPPDTSEGEKVQTPNLNEIIAEIISHPGWETGNNILLILTPQAGSANRTFKTLDGGYPSRITILGEDIGTDPVWRSYSDDYEQSYS